jgi:hypothetical protein
MAALLAAPERYADQVVTLRGVVSAVCQRRGCWLELAERAEAEASGCRVVSEHHDWFVPRDATGQRARVRGRVELRVISAAQVEHMESEGGRVDTKRPDGTARELRILASGLELHPRS